MNGTKMTVKELKIILESHADDEKVSILFHDDKDIKQVGYGTAPKEVIGAKSITLFADAKGYVMDGSPEIAEFAPFVENGLFYVTEEVMDKVLHTKTQYDQKNQTVIIVGFKNEIVLSLTGATLIIREGVRFFPLDYIAKELGFSISKDGYEKKYDALSITM